jgi:hypothetical protein
LEKLTGAYDGWAATPEIQQAILDIWVPNFWLSAAQVRGRLWAGRHISSLKEISENSIHRVAQGTGFAEVRRLLRPMFRFTPQVIITDMNQDYDEPIRVVFPHAVHHECVFHLDQYYQNMCGFDGIGMARKYLHLFELIYRFTPFAKDNRPVKGREMDIRGKCPLELAGYDISQMPIA